MGVAELQWFDRLARRAIDPAISVVKVEAEGHDPGYIVQERLDASPMRTRCLLTIANRQVNRPELGGTLVISALSDNKLRVEQSYRWPGEGETIEIATFDAAEVTQDKIEGFARAFVAQFYDRVQKYA